MPTRTIWIHESLKDETRRLWEILTKPPSLTAGYGAVDFLANLSLAAGGLIRFGNLLPTSSNVRRRLLMGGFTASAILPMHTEDRHSLPARL